MSFFNRIKNKITGSTASGSVFLKTQAADVQAEVAKARIAAVDKLNKLGHDTAAALETEAERVHQEADVLGGRFESLLAKL